jgi:DNA-binding NtrC family response regulator
MGFDVEVEVSPGNALDSIRAQKFDIVLVDYRMPEMPCRKFIDLACSLESCPRIAIITGDTTSVEVRSFAKEKNIPLIEKPFRVADMKELMNRLISR